MQIYQVGKPFVPYIKAAMQEEGILTTPKASFPFPEVTEEDRVGSGAFYRKGIWTQNKHFFSFRMHNRQLQSAKNRSNIMK